MPTYVLSLVLQYNNRSNTFKPEFTNVTFIHYKLQIAVAIIDFYWMKMTSSGCQMKKDIIIIKTVLQKMLFYMKNKILLEEAQLLILYYI